MNLEKERNWVWGRSGGVGEEFILITTTCISLSILCGPTKDTSTQNAQQQCRQSSRQSNQPERGSSIHTKGPFKLTRNKSEHCDEKCFHVKNKLKAVRIVLLMMELIIKDNWLTTYTHTEIYMYSMYWYKGMELYHHWIYTPAFYLLYIVQ